MNFSKKKIKYEKKKRMNESCSLAVVRVPLGKENCIRMAGRSYGHLPNTGEQEWGTCDTEEDFCFLASSRGCQDGV